MIPCRVCQARAIDVGAASAACRERRHTGMGRATVCRHSRQCSLRWTMNWRELDTPYPARRSSNSPANLFCAADRVIISPSAKSNLRWLEQIRSLSAAPLSPHSFFGSGWDARNLNLCWSSSIRLSNHFNPKRQRGRPLRETFGFVPSRIHRVAGKNSSLKRRVALGTSSLTRRVAM